VVLPLPVCAKDVAVSKQASKSVRKFLIIVFISVKKHRKESEKKQNSASCCMLIWEGKRAGLGEKEVSDFYMAPAASS
jgi:hypothetical protein